MSQSQGPSSSKRKRSGSIVPVDSLNEQERTIYNVIRSKEDMGIFKGDLKNQTKIPDNLVTKSLKVLQAKNLVKEVVHFQKKGKKHYMAVGFDPSVEITGGTWYVGGSLDMELIKSLKDVCLGRIAKLKVATLEGIVDAINKTGVFNFPLTKEKVGEILNVLVIDKAISEVKSNGSGEFSSIPVGKVCYKQAKKSSGIGAMASIPCGVCPNISVCTPHGLISPTTCAYYKKWLDF